MGEGVKETKDALPSPPRSGGNGGDLTLVTQGELGGTEITGVGRAGRWVVWPGLAPGMKTFAGSCPYAWCWPQRAGTAVEWRDRTRMEKRSLTPPPSITHLRIPPLFSALTHRQPRPRPKR